MTSLQSRGAMLPLEREIERAISTVKEVSEILVTQQNTNIRTQGEISRSLRREAELQQCIQHLITERDAVRRQAEAREMDATKYREQRDDVVAAMDKHNPEVIGAQEDLQDILGDAVVYGTSSTSGLPEPKLQDHVKRELSYHIALLPQPLSGGEARIAAFRDWLNNRMIPAAPAQVTDECTVVGELKRGFKFKRTDTRLCHEPVMFIQSHVAWIKYPQQHGLVICPRYEYGPTATFSSASAWSRSTRWRAYAEEKCEVFYSRAGKIHYAGTYLCHSGPCALQLDDLGPLATDPLVSALAKATRTSNYRTTEQEELGTIEELYNDGVLSIDIFGIERIGFNASLFDHMQMRYNHSLANRKTRTPVAPPLPPSPIMPLPQPVYRPPLPPAPTPAIVPNPVYTPPTVPTRSTRTYVPIASQLSALPAWKPLTPLLTRSLAPLTSTIASSSPLAPLAPLTSTIASSSSSAPLSSLSANTYSQNKRRLENVASSSSSARPAKLPRLSSYDYDSDGYRPEDDEGYLFYCGSNYYRRAQEEEEEAEAIYKSLNIPDIMGDMTNEEADDDYISPEEGPAIGRTSAYNHAGEDDEEEEYSDEE
ncbi:hypothetical protein ONZ51_g12726 [Trametes cubensis]|uniref:Uncharacterized protein n=1 Tax=Trametes cubensis TaxID=1111947 RepID=A0AAD7TFJ5_9APHY|nr:hypothetical protein ONZ51_g12726 [Trametes cubensis]